jgi:hypothetical protein
MNEFIKTRGDVDLTIDYLDGRPSEFKSFRNTILKNGREALALSLANDYGSSYDFFISRMIFGSSGTTGGAKKFVSADRNALFGVTEVSKPIVASVNDTQVIFTSVIAFSEADGVTLNEMALQMNNEDLYSMVTMNDLVKTTQMQLTWNWRLNFI